MKIHELTTEAEKPTKLADPTDIDWDIFFDEPVSKGSVATVEPKADQKPKAAPEIKKATAAQTAQALKGMTPTDAMRDMIGKMNIPDDALAAEPDIEVGVPTAAENVPAVISKAIKTVGSEVGDQTAIDPEFHQVKNLPGYISKPIRVMGRETFKPYTTTPIENISVIANLGGQGPNSNREINGVAAWLKTNAKEVDRAQMDYGATMPGYVADTISYSASGVRFLVVKDQHGQYIYAWPETDSVNQLDQKAAPKQLR